MQIELTERDLGVMLLSTVRYAFNRPTYAVEDACWLLRRFWKRIPASYLDQIHTDIERVLENEGANRSHWEYALKVTAHDPTR